MRGSAYARGAEGGTATTDHGIIISISFLGHPNGWCRQRDLQLPHHSSTLPKPDPWHSDRAVGGLQARGTELVGEVENYKDTYLLCYVRGPEGIIVELVEKIG